MAKKTKTQETAPQPTQAPAKTYRTVGDINAEYGQICSQIGDREVKIAFLQAEIFGLKQRCKELNDEIGALPKTQPPAQGPGNESASAAK